MGGKNYREGVADSSLLGPMTMWEDGSDVVRAASATYPLPVDATGAGDVPSVPFAPIAEAGIKELVGKDEQVDQNDFSGSVDLLGLGSAVSGEFLSLILTTLETGSGAVQTPAGTLIFFDADPNPTPGDTALTAAEWKTAIGSVDIAAADWISDANGSHCFKQIAIPLHALASVYAVWFHTDATSLNDAAGDDEELHCNLWYRRDS